MQTDPVIEARDLRKWFPVRRGTLAVLARREPEFVKAVDGVSLAIGEGEVLELVGESGSGKSTIGMTLLKLLAPIGGRRSRPGRCAPPGGGCCRRGWRCRCLSSRSS